MGKGKKVKIGYWYSFGIHMGWGRGPVDELVKITVADEVAWEGSVTSSSNFVINKENLFGGEKGEGGIVGNCWVMMGDENQVAQPNLAAMMGRMNVPCPAFRGRATFFYDGKVCALNPYPKAWRFRIRRSLKGWDGGSAWYPAKCVIPLAGGTIKATNAIHVIYEALLDRDWGRGLDAGRLEVATFTAAADTLYNEGFGVCLRWNRQGTVTDFIQSVIDCIGAVLDINRRTGKLYIKLIRDDYNVADLPHFTYGTGLLGLEDYETPAQDSATNQVTVKYHDPVTDEDMVTPPVDNLAAIQTSGGTNPSQFEYLMVPTGDLAARLAIRDLQANMGTIRKLTLQMDRRAADVRPGDVIVISAPDYGISSMAVRVISYKDGEITDGEITLTVAQDVFGLPSTSYVEVQPPGWVPPDRIAREPAVRRLREAGYRDVLQNAPTALQSTSNSSAFLQGLATKPLGMALGYEFWTGTGTYEERNTGDWVPVATLGQDMPLSGEDITVSLSAYDDMALYEIGQVVFIDDEELIIANRDITLGTLTLQRGTLDTIPAPHTAGARVWLYSDYQAFDTHEWVSGSYVSAKFLTFTTQDSLPLDRATSLSLGLTGRVSRPYPPGNVRINGQPYYQVASVTGEIVITYSHRDRIAQDDQLFSHSYGNIGPETGVKYAINVLDATGGTLRTIRDLTGTSWTYTSEMATADGSQTQLGFELYSYRGDVNSWQKYSFKIRRAGLGLFLGQYLGGVAQ